jgi:hypothetical protein
MCSSCDGKFGLIRHYCWRTAPCSKKRVVRFRSRREAKRNWYPGRALPDMTCIVCGIVSGAAT